VLSVMMFADLEFCELELDTRGVILIILIEVNRKEFIRSDRID